MLSKRALQGENADSKVATHVNQSRFERPQGGRGCVPSKAVVTRGAVEMKPAAVVCVLALVLVLTAAASAAPDVLRGSSGVGSVFVTNPVQSLGDESLTDQKDADAAVPQAAYHEVALTNLDGSGFLRGDFADVVTETGKAAFSSTNTFRYTRHQDESSRSWPTTGSPRRRSTSAHSA